MEKPVIKINVGVFCVERSRKTKINLYALIPVAMAIVVVIAFAISGSITKNSDKEKPTAQTSVSVANEDSTVKKPTENSKVSIVAVGDNLIHNTLITAGETEDSGLDYKPLYANIKPEIEKADIAVINQETILGGESFEYTGYPLFNSPWEIGDAAIDAGFDIFTCATNHTLDMGWDGIEKEIEYFSKNKNVVQIGVNSSADKNITYYEKNSITFSLLNYTYGTNGIDPPADKPWCVNLFEKETVTADIKEAREHSDVVIVFAHWGTENSHEVSQYQQEYTKLFSDLGVDIVIGTHPHVIQNVEWVTNEQSGKKMLVYYSLGNFISHQIQLDQLCGGMAQITVEKKGENIEISTAKFVPLICHYKRGEDDKFVFNVYKLSDYTNDLAATHSQEGGTVEYYSQLVRDVIDEEFLD